MDEFVGTSKADRKEWNASRSEWRTSKYAEASVSVSATGTERLDNMTSNRSESPAGSQTKTAGRIPDVSEIEPVAGAPVFMQTKSQIHAATARVKGATDQAISSPPMSPVQRTGSNSYRPHYGLADESSESSSPISWSYQPRGYAGASSERMEPHGRHGSLRSDTDRSETPLSLTSVTPSDSDNDGADPAGTRLHGQ